MPPLFNGTTDSDIYPAGQSGQDVLIQKSSPERDDRPSNPTITIRVIKAEDHDDDDDHRLPPLDLPFDVDGWSSSPTDSPFSMLHTPLHPSFGKPPIPASPYTVPSFEGDTLLDPRCQSMYTSIASGAEARDPYSQSQPASFDVSKSTLLAPAPLRLGNIPSYHATNLACDLNYLSTYRDPWSPSLSSSASHSPVPSDCELDSSSGYVYVGEDSQNTIEKMLLQSWVISDSSNHPLGSAEYLPSPYPPTAPLPGGTSVNDQVSPELAASAGEDIQNAFLEYLSSIPMPLDFTESYLDVPFRPVEFRNGETYTSDSTQRQMNEHIGVLHDQFPLFLFDEPPERPLDLRLGCSVNPTSLLDYNYYHTDFTPPVQHWCEITLKQDSTAFPPVTHDHEPAMSSNQPQPRPGDPIHFHPSRFAKADEDGTSSLEHLQSPMDWTASLHSHSQPCQIYSHHATPSVVHMQAHTTPVAKHPSESNTRSKQHHESSLRASSSQLHNVASSGRQPLRKARFDDAEIKSPSAAYDIGHLPMKSHGRGASSGGGPLRGSKRDPGHDSKYIVHRVLVDSRTRDEAERRVRELTRGSDDAHCVEEFQAALNRRPRVSQRGLEKSNNRRKTERRFSCILCTATVTTNDNLQNHYRSHLIFNEFACERCKRYFRTTSILNRHQNEAQQCLVLHSTVQEPKRDSCS